VYGQQKTDLIIRIRGITKPTIQISKSAHIAVDVHLFLSG